MDKNDGAVSADTLNKAIGKDKEEKQKDIIKSIWQRLTLSELKDVADSFSIIYDDEITKEEMVDLLVAKIRLSVEEKVTKDTKIGSKVKADRRKELKLPTGVGNNDKINVGYDQAYAKTEKDEKGNYKIIAYGHCTVKYGERQLNADLIIVNFKDKDQNATTDSESDDSDKDNKDNDKDLKKNTDKKLSNKDKKKDKTDADANLLSKSELEKNQRAKDKSKKTENSDKDKKDAEENSDETEDDNASKGRITEVMGMGDIYYVDKSNKIKGEKFFYYFDKRWIIVYNAISYFKPFYVKASKAKQISPGTFIIEDALFSSCNLEHPHYLIHVDRAWLYNEELAVLTNPYYQIGDSIFFYFPIIFRSEFGTGLQTAIGIERGIGWWMNNTIDFKIGEKGSATLMADYYQKIGFYLGTKVKYDPLTLDLGTAYDRSAKYVGDFESQEIFSNYFDVNGNGKPTENNAFRYSIKIGLNLPLAADASENLDKLFEEFDKKDQDTSKTEMKTASGTQGNSAVVQDNNKNEAKAILNKSKQEEQDEYIKKTKDAVKDKVKGFLDQIKPVLTLNFSQVSDPYFQSQFEGSRSTNFDLKRLLEYNKESSRSRVGPSELPITGTSSAGNGRKLDFQAGASIGQLGIRFSGSWDWGLYVNDENTTSTQFNPLSFYKFELNQIIFPNVAVTTSGKIVDDIFAIFKDDAQKASDDKNKTNNTTDPNSQKQNSYNEEASKAAEEKKKKEKEKDSTSLDDNQQVKDNDKFIITFPINYTFNFGFNETKYYKYGIKERDTFNTDIGGGISYPINISYGFVETSINNSFNVSNTDKNTKNPTDDQKINDQASSYTRWTASHGGSINFKFLEEYEYLETKFGVTASYNTARRLDKEVARLPIGGGSYTDVEGDNEYTEGWNGSFNFYFAKTTFTASTSQSLRIPWSKLKTIGTTETVYGHTITEDDLKRQNWGPFSMSLSSNPFKNFTINQSYSESFSQYQPDNRKNGIFGGISQSYTVSSSYTLDIQKDLGDYFSINKFSFSGSYNHNYLNMISNSASISWTSDFNITRDWQFAITGSTTNNKLYRYSKDLIDKYKGKWVNPLTDIVNSFNVFDKSARKNALWKTGAFSLSLLHSLHEWDMQFNFQFQPRTVIYNTYWEPSFSFQVSLRDLPGFAAPPIESLFNRV